MGVGGLPVGDRSQEREGVRPGVDVAHGSSGAREVTLTAVARRAGVSPATVSRVVNGRPGVARETRARVGELLRRHGFHPPGRVDPGRAALVQVVFHELDAWAMEILRGVVEVAAGTGLGTVVSALPEEASAVARERWLAGLRRRAPDGVILAMWALDPAFYEEVRGLGVPVVVV
ncbi:LacI family transcriptional regulator, partial [Streptomyces radicis]